MKRIFLHFFLAFSVSLAVQAQKTTIDKALFELPDVIFKEIKSSDSTVRTFELQVKQPLDHQHPDKGYFYQRAFLSHKGFDRPMLMYISGYGQDRVFNNELTPLLGANQLSIEHRFFGTSVPESLDYSYLNLEQATADLHYINELFKKIYAGKWVSTGISKGGATTIFYKYFFPNDVDAAIPYVAPINREYEDKRIYSFLSSVGTEACRKKIFEFQKRMFHNRDKVLPLLKMYSEGAKLTFTYLSLEQAFEYSVLEYPFAFWQYGSSCEEIPAETSSLEEAVLYLNKVSDIQSFSDASIDTYLPHYYQSATQMGYYSYLTEPFKDDLKALPLKPHPSAAILPKVKGIATPFDGSLLKKVNEWVAKDGNRIAYIYGADDTWTATGVPSSDKVDAVWFFMKGKNHRSARVAQMTPEEKKKFVATLERWLGTKISNKEAE
ncbi:MAG: hypothetical protein BGN96_12670 [Bacteroidales bacterium 45-6]|nr:MAG: hypothetical protein BGN96_12670 [Bacteroidales bacterium 45-6]